MARDPHKYFRVEARELLDELVKGVLDLEKVVAVSIRVAKRPQSMRPIEAAAVQIKRTRA